MLNLVNLSKKVLLGKGLLWVFFVINGKVGELGVENKLVGVGVGGGEYRIIVEGRFSEELGYDIYWFLVIFFIIGFFRLLL